MGCVRIQTCLNLVVGFDFRSGKAKAVGLDLVVAVDLRDIIVKIAVDFLFPSWWEVKVSVTAALFVIIASWLFIYGGGGGDSNRSSFAGDDIDGSKYKWFDGGGGSGCVSTLRKCYGWEVVDRKEDVGAGSGWEVVGRKEDEMKEREEEIRVLVKRR
ncbi:hypothetical protein LguiA_020112 [Lonicera macranthoides]